MKDGHLIMFYLIIISFVSSFHPSLNWPYPQLLPFHFILSRKDCGVCVSLSRTLWRLLMQFTRSNWWANSEVRQRLSWFFISEATLASIINITKCLLASVIAYINVIFHTENTHLRFARSLHTTYCWCINIASFRISKQGIMLGVCLRNCWK